MDTKVSFVGTPTYRSWQSMKARCKGFTPSRKKNYTDRGITYDPRWEKFGAFLEDMGVRPVGTTLDREENDKGYTKDNCRWASPKQQLNNTRWNRRLTLDGTTRTTAEWASQLDISPMTIGTRLWRGWSVERALTKPWATGRQDARASA